MGAINIYQGNTRSISVSLTNEDGTPYNASGCVLYYTARQDYVSQSYLFNIATTGLGPNLPAALTGLFVINVTSGDTTQCAGLYPAGFTLVDVNSGISTFGTEGLNILAAPLVL